MKQKKQKRTRMILRILLLSLAGIILGANLYAWNAGRVLGEQMPMPFGIGISVVLSGSMEPTLHVGDLIIVKETDTLYDRQIIVYEDSGDLIVHRIIALDEKAVTTQGDANDTADTPISREAVKGELVASIPMLGNLILFLREPMVVLIILGGAIFLTEYSYRKEKKKNQDELAIIQEEIRSLANDLKNGHHE